LSSLEVTLAKLAHFSRLRNNCKANTLYKILVVRSNFHSHTVWKP